MNSQKGQKNQSFKKANAYLHCFALYKAKNSLLEVYCMSHMFKKQTNDSADL